MSFQISINTPLGPDKLIVYRFSYTEQLGRLFRLDADLISTDNNIQFDKLIGESVTISIALADGKFRYFNGIVSGFSQSAPLGRYACYQATISPFPWLLSRTSDCRIFQEKTVPEIVKAILKEEGYADLLDHLKGTYTPWSYCVQYRETDFNFISRLLEHEGIYYFWKHEENGHKMVLVDDPSSHEPFPGYEKIRFLQAHRGFSGGGQISEWSVRKEIQPGSYELTDYNFQKPKIALGGRSSVQQSHSEADREIFDYPGEYDESGDASKYTKIRIQELHSQHEAAQGATDSRGISAGSTFTLEEHPRKDRNRKYLITSADYQVQAEQRESGLESVGSVRCSFEAIPDDVHFRCARATPRPVVQGPQTAIVTGPKGHEIHVDEHGRVKVQFFWDRYGKGDQDSSCWIRVSQAWAGQGWGAMNIPRIGQEVIVDFLEGDPDQPIISGRVYNAQVRVPYALPDHKTITTFKTNSSEGGAGFNELRFEDKKGEEQVFLHGEKNLDIRIKNDGFEWIGNNRHLIVKKDQIERVENNREETVDADHKESIGKDRHLKITGKEAKEVGESHSFVVKGDVIEVFKKDHSEQTSDNYYLKADNVVIEGMTNVTIKVGQSYIAIESSGIKIGSTQIEIEGQSSVSVKGNSGVTVESAAQVEVKGTATSVKGDATLTLKGGMVNIN